MIRRALLALLPLVGTGSCHLSSFCMCNTSADALFVVLGQTATQYTDPENGWVLTGITDPVHQVTYGLTFPPLATSGAQSNEFIGEISAPIDALWVGFSVGGAMLDNLLLVAWPWNGQLVTSTRYAT